MGYSTVNHYSVTGENLQKANTFLSAQILFIYGRLATFLLLEYISADLSDTCLSIPERVACYCNSRFSLS